MGRNKSKQARRAEQWAKDHKKINWEVVWKVLASVFSFAGSMVAVYELVNYFRSDAKTFYSIIFPGLAVIVWVIILVQLIRKKNSYANLLLSVTVFGSVVGGIGWRSYNQTQDGKLIVLVAQFDGPEETYGLHDQIMEDLRKATRGYNDTVIIDGKDIVTSGQGSEYARDLGKKAKADVVIWAWYRPTDNPNISIHLENLSPKGFSFINESETYQPTASIVDLKTFEIQKRIGTETVNLVNFLAGYLRYRNHDWKIALELFGKVSESEEDISSVNQKYLFVYSGHCYHFLGQFNDAVKEYDLALQADNNFAVAYLGRGTAYGELGQYSQEFQDLDLAIQLDPTIATAYSNQGYAYNQLERYERAIQDFDRALQLDPEFVVAYNNRGFSYLQLGQYELAIQDLDRAIELDPHFANPYLWRGTAYEKLGKTRNAEADFKKYEELTGQKP